MLSHYFTTKFILEKRYFYMDDAEVSRKVWEHVQTYDSSSRKSDKSDVEPLMENKQRGKASPRRTGFGKRTILTWKSCPFIF